MVLFKGTVSDWGYGRSGVPRGSWDLFFSLYIYINDIINSNNCIQKMLIPGYDPSPNELMSARGDP